MKLRFEFEPIRAALMNREISLDLDTCIQEVLWEDCLLSTHSLNEEPKALLIQPHHQPMKQLCSLLVVKNNSVMSVRSRAMWLETGEYCFATTAREMVALFPIVHEGLIRNQITLQSVAQLLFRFNKVTSLTCHPQI